MIDKEELLKLLEIVLNEYPYKVPGKPETYCSYNEGWTDGLCRLESMLGSIEKDIDLPDTDFGKWIPCSERMPDEHDSIFAKFKGTDRWSNGMFERCSDTVNVTVVGNDGSRVTIPARTTDGSWSCDLLRADKSCRIIAWMPLPEPYRKEKKV